MHLIAPSRAVIIAGALAVAICAGAIAVAAAAGPATATRRGRSPQARTNCARLHPRRFHVLARNALGTLFKQGSSTDGSTAGADLGVCVRGGRRGGRLLLVAGDGFDTAFSTVGFSSPRLAGPHIAWIDRSSDVSPPSGGCAAALVSIRPPYRRFGSNDLGPLGSLHYAGRPRPLNKAGFIATGRAECAVGGLVLTPGGTVAWLERVSDPRAGRSTAVRAMTAKSVKLLDRGTQIPAKSFRLTGHTLSWTNAGQPRSAQLA